MLIRKFTHCDFLDRSSKQEIITVQAPQPPSPHPSFVPVRPISTSRKKMELSFCLQS